MGIVAVSLGLGIPAGLVVVAVGNVGHNRNPVAASFLGGLAAFAAAALSSMITIRLGFFPDEGSRLLAGVIMTIAGLIAIVIAVTSAYRGVKDAKYCEACRRYLTSVRLARLTFDEAIAFRALAQRRGLDEGSPALGESRGEDVEISLATCASCSRGILEGVVCHQARWIDGGRERSELWQWPFLSLWIEPREASRLAPVHRLGREGRAVGTRAAEG